MPDRVLVTGVGGFVGHHLVEHLEAEGDEVFGTDRAIGGPDITDADAFEALLHDVSPDIVYHLAAQSDVAGSWDHARETLRINVDGTHVVLAACRGAGVRRVVAVTSADIYGLVDPEQLPLTESAPLRPVSPYAASKAAADMVCLQAHLGYGQDVIRVRSFNHFGPGQSERFVAPALAARVVEAERAGESAIRVGSLAARRDFTDVRDVVAAYRALAGKAVAGEAYNVCSGVDISIAELAEKLVSRSSVPLSLEVDPNLERPADLPVLRGSCAKLRQATAWTPRFTLDQSIDAILDDQRSRRSATKTKDGH